MDKLHLYNSLTRKKEEFEPINPPFVGLYVCGPTVYGDPHLGHARPYITFDILNRYLRYLGYQVRYVRNITDVGHLTDDADEGDDKIEKKARLDRKEPMEIAQYYTNRFHDAMDALNTLRPEIEPHATGHIPEQIEYIQSIIDHGFAYEVDGSVYFDVEAYNKQFQYGKLSGRTLDETHEGYRELEGQQEKRNPFDFALWKKAGPDKLMRWNSPWGPGVPGWHIECTAMSTKYLGPKYDIHGGGMDLLFPHHEGEIAQSNACHGVDHPHEQDEAKYWLHNNMITINGQKMGKSLGNFITLNEFFSGKHEKLEQAYHPMTIRFFILQAHYRSTVDFSNEALQASEKALKRLTDAMERLDAIEPKNFHHTVEDEEITKALGAFDANCRADINDDMNTAKVIANMFNMVPVINSMAAHKGEPFPVKTEVFEDFREKFHTWFSEILGMKPAEEKVMADDKTAGLMELLISLRNQARKNKDFALSDQIRDQLQTLGIQLKDTPEGTVYE